MAIDYYFLSPENLELPTSNTREGEALGEALRIALALNRGNSAEQLTDILFETLDPFVPYDRIGVSVVEPGGMLALRYARSRMPVKWGLGARGHYRDSSLAPVVLEQKIRIIDDLEAYAQEHPTSETSAFLIAEGMRSNLTLPLLAGDETIGVLFISSHAPRAYNLKHVSLLRLLSVAIGIALRRSQLTDELRRANAELRSLDQLKTDFLSNLSHELRTPLSLVLNYSYALDDEIAGQLTPEQHRYLKEVIHAGDRLNQLLTELFEFTALQSGAFQLNRTALDLVALAHEVGEEMAPAIAEQGLTFEQRLPSTALEVAADPPRLAQVIRLLLDNAIKFTPAPGHVTLTADGDERVAWIEVTDTGIGLAPEDQGRIFEKFTQVEHGPSRQYGGTGLGLPLAKALMEAFGGTLWVTSEFGKGSTFRMTLPRVLTG